MWVFICFCYYNDTQNKNNSRYMLCLDIVFVVRIFEINNEICVRFRKCPGMATFTHLQCFSWIETCPIILTTVHVCKYTMVLKRCHYKCTIFRLFSTIFTSQETFVFYVYFGCLSLFSSMDWISRLCHMAYSMWHKLEHDRREFLFKVSV